VARMQSRQPSGDATQIVPSSKTAEHDLDHGAPVDIGRAVAGSHMRTLRLSPSRPPVLVIASRNVWKERHFPDTPMVFESRLIGVTFSDIAPRGSERQP
jgi:hypothetical protein